MREQADPTHVLRIDVPLDLAEPPAEFDAVQDALRISLAVSRASFVGAICSEVQVSLEEQT
jgi:hypothetical protein